jgi:UDP-N-acetylglucosamine 2-epimerase (non-hydrolysing)
MKVVTVLGTRPELIRLSVVIGRLDELCDHVLVHTGQNFHPRLSSLFLDELRIRTPDYQFSGGASSFAEQLSGIIANVGKVLEEQKPDALLVLGDTNSALSVILAKRAGIPVFHMEAGNRCFDERVPEEVNRRVIDHASTVLLPYTQRSKENLLREGIPSERIIVTGNPICEVLSAYADDIAGSSIHARLGLTAGKDFLLTMHRAETVDVEPRLRSLVESIEAVSEVYNEPVVCSLHPRTRDRMEQLGMSFEEEAVRYLEPMGFFDFVALEKQSHCVLTDSGTVQEECAIFRVPSVTLRDVTERPETLEAGSNMLSGVRRDDALRAVRVVLSAPPVWDPPDGYLDADVSTKVIKAVLGGGRVHDGAW